MKNQLLFASWQRKSLRWVGWAAFFTLSTIIFTLLIHSILNQNPFGADFFTFWLAGRATFLEHASPYSAEVTLQSQLGIYKRPALASEDQLAFAYPPYSLLAILPTIPFDFDWAQSFWLAINILLILIALYSVFSSTSRWFSLAWLAYYPLVFGLILGNFAIILSAVVLIIANRFHKSEPLAKPGQIITGIVLAWATIKPQFIWLYLIIFLFLAYSRRWKVLLISFVSSLVFFFAVSFVIIPGWLGQWLSRIFAYALYVRSQPVLITLLTSIFPSIMANVIAVVIFIICLAVTAALLSTVWHNQLDLLLLFAWCGFFTYLFHPHGLSYEQLIFVVPFSLFCVNIYRNQRVRAIILWLVGLTVSWVSFSVGKFIGSEAGVQLPFLFYTIWLVVLFYKYNCSHILWKTIRRIDA
jgi:hypothetical protein